MRQELLQSRFPGGMVGSALGDAIGEIAFRFRREQALLSAVSAAETLVYTDDTAMAMGIAESLGELGEINPEHLGETFRKNYEREPWRGYASGPPAVFSMIRKGKTYADAARSLFGGTGSFGNGAAMRIAPVGLYYCDSNDLYERAAASARVTHAHALGVDGAAVLAKAVALAATAEPGKRPAPVNFCEKLRAFARTRDMKQSLRLLAELIVGKSDVDEAARALGTTVEAHNSVPYAIFAFLKNPKSFRQCLLDAVLAGGDRDTIGAMACAISGANLGLEAIPKEWRDKLENAGRIQSAALKLLERKLS